MVAIPVPKRIHMLGLVASDLAVGDAGLGLLGAAGGARGETPALVETVGTHEAAQRRIGRHRLEIRLRLGPRDEIVVMQLDAPALVGGVLCEHRAADGVAARVLLPSIAAHLAPEHADRIGALSDRTVIPALDSGEAESHGLARRRMLPRALCQIGNCRPQLALLRRRRQQPADDSKAQVGPLLVNTLMTLATSAVRHDGAPRKRDAAKRSTAVVFWRRASSAGGEQPRRAWPARHRACIAAPPVMGPRKRSSAISGSAPSPVKRSISATGSRSCSTGGMNRARAIRQNGVAVNASRHQWRQRAIVRRSTLATSESRAKRASVAPCFRMAISTTIAAT